MDSEGWPRDSHIKVFVPERIERPLDGARRKLLDPVYRDHYERIGESKQVSLRQTTCTQDWQWQTSGMNTETRVLTAGKNHSLVILTLLRTISGLLLANESFSGGL